MLCFCAICHTTTPHQIHRKPNAFLFSHFCPRKQKCCKNSVQERWKVGLPREKLKVQLKNAPLIPSPSLETLSPNLARNVQIKAFLYFTRKIFFCLKRTRAKHLRVRSREAIYQTSARLAVLFTLRHRKTYAYS